MNFEIAKDFFGFLNDQVSKLTRSWSIMGPLKSSFAQPINPKVDFSLQWFTSMLIAVGAGTTYLAAEQLILLA